jgi:histidyl-tRNA synthetase
VNGNVISTLREILERDTAGMSGVSELSEIISLTEHTSARGRVQLDIALARGLSYYTGAIMEIASPHLRGSLGGGGRYDKLIGMFLGQDIPACGFSLGLERILVVMTENDMFKGQLAPAVDAMLTRFEAGPVNEVLDLAAELRGQKLAIEMYPEPAKLGKQFKYAAERGIRFALIVGPDEVKAGQVAIKDLEAGTQTSIPRAEVASYLTNSARARSSSTA